MTALECEMYDAPWQDCVTAGPDAIKVEGLCGPCAIRHLAIKPEPKHEARPPHPLTMAGGNHRE